MWFWVAAVLVASGGAAPVKGKLSPHALDAMSVVASGLLCLAIIPMPYGLLAAAAVAPAVVLGVRRLASRAPPDLPDRGTALAFALAAAALRAGMPVPAALEVSAPAGAPALGKVARLLQLGATPAQAWADVPTADPWPAVGFSAGRSGASGAKLAAALDRAADQIVAAIRTRSLARAQRVDVLAVGPLGLCFLPAFVCLGIAPAVVAIAAGVGQQLT